MYPNRMSFDIMPNGGKSPEPKGLLVVKVKAVTNIKAGGDLFSKVHSSPIALWWQMHPFAVLVMLTLGINTWGISVVQVRNVLSRSSGQACPFSRCEAGLIFCALVAAETFVRYSALRLGYWPVQLNCVSRAQVDPFVDMSVRDGRSQCTKTIWNNKDPVFNQVLSFIVNDPEHQSITAMVKDDDMQAFSKVRLNAGCNLRCHM